MLNFLPLWKHENLLFILNLIYFIVVRTLNVRSTPLTVFKCTIHYCWLGTTWYSRFSRAYSSFLRSNFGFVCESSFWRELKCYFGFHWTHVIPYLKVLWPRSCSSHSVFTHFEQKYWSPFPKKPPMEVCISYKCTEVLWIDYVAFCHHFHLDWIAYNSLLFTRQSFQDPYLRKGIFKGD